ncbi:MULTISPECIES: hypothetical protein [unclassified Streptomyces]|uniref:hypothetical protein n=1 Tax=unclassified Streptomyces TaxID=2593676 RepID=UPI002966EE59|nr:hypothetical protein [Streptomyces sp. SJL17-1]
MLCSRRAVVYVAGIAAALCVGVTAAPATAYGPGSDASGDADDYLAHVLRDLQDFRTALGYGSEGGDAVPRTGFAADGPPVAYAFRLPADWVPHRLSPATTLPGDPSPPSMDMPGYPQGDQPDVKISDPCADGSKNPAGCGAREGIQKEIEDCPPGKAGCLAKYATDGEATRTDLNSTANFVNTLANKDRYASPRGAAAQMCGIFSQLVSFYRADQYEFPPTTANCLQGLSGDDQEHATVTPVGTLTRLPAEQSTQSQQPPSLRPSR